MNRFFDGARRFFRKADLPLLVLCLIASAFGVLVISSAARHFEDGRYVFIQCAAILIGVALFVFFSFFDISILAEQRELLMIFNILFISTLFVFGVQGTTGNRSWLTFSWLPFNLQPAEICKISFILILAKTMSVHRNQISSVQSVLRILAITLVTMGVIVAASSDAGEALVFAFIFVIMAFIGGVNLGWFALGVGIIGVSAPLLWNTIVREDQKQRILMIFDPAIDPTGIGVRYQTQLSQNYISHGGLAGQGLFQGVQTQAGTMPAQHTDFIFSVIGNELGMIGCIFTLLILSIILIRCVYIGVKSGSYQNRLICTGIAGMLLFQIIVNVGMCLGLFPVVGLTLPFISYGGSSTVTTFAAIGIISGIKMHPTPDSETLYVRAPSE
ncbi:MAG: FtsW/RodA/SpoVE family cell cycle protein [Oscillospiraceae bacterium]|nr:FtsW/RodA/SpoVE family cell cycle protein [Oscillospiraceae bacterium]